MTQGVKVLTAKSDDLGLNLKDHVVELELTILTSTCVL